MISAPSEMRCKSMPSSAMTTKTIASTSGTEVATTMPARQPSDEEADRQHDRQRLDEGPREFDDRLVDDLRLIGDALHRDAARQVGLELGERRVERLAERQDVAALLHDDADSSAGCALGADEKRRRVLVAVGDVRRYRRGGTSGRRRRRACPHRLAAF